MDIQDTAQQMTEIFEKLSSLENLYELVNSTFQFHVTIIWSVTIGIFAIIGAALHFIAKSMVEEGIQRGLDTVDKNINELDIKNTEHQTNINLHMDEFIKSHNQRQTEYERGLEERMTEHEKTVSQQISALEEKLNTLIEKFDNQTLGSFRLPLVKDYEYVESAEFWKNSAREVTISFCIKRADNEAFPFGRNIIGIMPEGFRPILYTATTLGYSMDEAATSACKISVNNRGEIIVWVSSQADTLSGTITYLSE
jgi:hypothetical protein